MSLQRREPVGRRGFSGGVSADSVRNEASIHYIHYGCRRKDAARAHEGTGGVLGAGREFRYLHRQSARPDMGRYIPRVSDLYARNLIEI